MDKTDKLLIAIRAGLLMLVDAIEEYRGMPRTKDLRKKAKRVVIGENDDLSGAV